MFDWGMGWSRKGVVPFQGSLNRAGWTGWMFPEPRSVDFLLEAAFFDIPKLENWNWCLWYPTLGEYWFKGNLTKDFTKNPWLDTQYFGCIIYQYSWVVGFSPAFFKGEIHMVENPPRDRAGHHRGTALESDGEATMPSTGDSGRQCLSGS